MKKLLLSVSLSAMGIVLFAQTSGGPDTYGYTWKNQAAPGGPVYNWKEIKGTGTQITTLGDDNSAGPFNMNWNFHYYWSNFNKVIIGSNGWMNFGTANANIAAPFPPIPTATAPNNVLAPMMSDLTFTAGNNQPVPGASAWYWTNNVDTLIVQYDSVPYWVNPAPGYSGRYTFQVILSGIDSSVTFQYKLTQTGTTAYAMTSEGLKTGMENLTGQIGLQVLDAVFPTANTAVKFYYPNPVTYQVYDATPAWNQNTANGGFFVTKGNPINLVTNIENTGNQSLTTVNVSGQLLDNTFTQVWNSTSSLSALIAGANSTITYPTTYTTSTSGSFIYRSIISSTVPADINSGNDITDNEMVVVDTSLAVDTLSFSRATTATTGLNWQGGGSGSGGGVYIIPPFYPATVVSLDYFISAGTTGGFISQILKDDGPGNSPGTILYTDTVLSSIINAYKNVPLTSPVVVSSGGIYVSWLMYPDTAVSLGLDQMIPLSNRNYEIIGGNWALYRNNSTDDLMIKANVSKTVGVTDIDANVLFLSQNYPNPTNNYTFINFTLPLSGEVKFAVKNILGQDIDAINLGNQSAGTHTIYVNTSKFSQGIYFYSVKFGDKKEVTKKMIISR